MKQTFEFMIILVILFSGCKRSNHIERVTINGYSIGDTFQHGEFLFTHDFRDTVILGTHINDTGFSIQSWNDTIIWMMKSYLSEEESKNLISKISSITRTRAIITKTVIETGFEYLWFDSLSLDQIKLSIVKDKNEHIMGSLEIYNEWFIHAYLPRELEPEIEVYK